MFPKLYLCEWKSIKRIDRLLWIEFPTTFYTICKHKIIRFSGCMKLLVLFFPIFMYLPLLLTTTSYHPNHWLLCQFSKQTRSNKCFQKWFLMFGTCQTCFFRISENKKNNDRGDDVVLRVFEWSCCLIAVLHMLLI